MKKETQLKLKTNIVKSKKQINKYQIAIIIAFIGIVITTFIQSALFRENLVKNKRLFSNDIVSISDINLEKIPRLPEGFEAVNLNKDTEKYQIIKDVYSKENFNKWNKEYFAVKDETVWKWLGAFKYKIVYYKNNEKIASATYSKAFNENDKEINFSDLNKKVKEATHFKYEIADIDSKDETFSLHQAFIKDGYKSNGIWVSWKELKIDSSKYNTYGKAYDLVKKASNVLNKDGKEFHDTFILNTLEYGAIKVAKQENIFFKTKENTTQEMVLGYLNNGNLSNGQSIVNDLINNDVKYPKAEKSSSENNFMEAILDGSKFGDGFSDTRGLINKETSKKSIEPTKFLNDEKSFFVINKNEKDKKIDIESHNGEIQSKDNIGARLVLRLKSIPKGNKVNFTFKVGQNEKLLKDGKEITEYKYEITKGGLITEEKLASFNLKPIKDGYTFKKWNINPTANIYYEDQVITPEFEKDSNIEGSVARFYFNYENESEYVDLKGNIGERITKERVSEIELKMKEKGLNVEKWYPDYSDKKFTKGMQKYYPVISTFDTEKEKYIYFTFYANGQKEEWITIRAMYDITKPLANLDKEKEEDSKVGIAPNHILDLQEKLANLKISNNSTDVFDRWNISLNTKQTLNTEYEPIFKPAPKPDPDPDPKPEETVYVYVDYNGSRIAPQKEMKYTIKKGTSIKDNPELYEQMMDERHVRPNFELPEDKTKWYDHSLTEKINKTTTFKLLWKRSEINVKFWNAPKDYNDKKIISNQTVPAGGKANLPDASLVIPFYEVTNPVTGQKYKRTFNKATGWSPEGINEPIYINSPGVSKINGTYQMDVYPVFENEYIDPKQMVTLRFNLNEPKGEEGNVYYPDKNFFKERKMMKGAKLFNPDSNQKPRLAGYIFKGFSPELPLLMNEDKVVTLLWEKRAEYIPWNPGSNREEPGSNNSNENNRWSWTAPKNNLENKKNNTKNKNTSNIEIKSPEKEKNKDEKTKVNVDAGLKASRGIVTIGSILTTIIIFSYIRIVMLNNKVKRNEEDLKNIW